MLGDNVGSLDVAGTDKGVVEAGDAVSGEAVLLDKLKSDDSTGCPLILPVDESAVAGAVVTFGGEADVGGANAVGVVVDDIDGNDKRSLDLVVVDD